MKYIALILGLLFTFSLEGQDEGDVETLEFTGEKNYNSIAFDYNVGGSSKTIIKGGAGFRYASGYRVNKWLNFGGGIGFEFFDFGDKNNYYSSRNHILFIPVYLDVRGELTNWNIRPFYQTELGLGFKVKNELDNYDNIPSGVYFRPQIGWKFKTKSNFASTIGFGFILQSSTEKRGNKWIDETYLHKRKRTYQRYFIQFGFEF